jgi:sulfoxide reductase heme-binding subunit YedZ
MIAVAAVSHTGTALWYLTRATGLVSLILLSGTVILGVVSSVGWTAHRWPRFVSQTMHRNLSLFCLVLIAIHVITTVADGYVPIGYTDAFIPFFTAYRPLYIGLGALAFDLLLTVAITSGLRRRIGVRSWRGVHYLAYVSWPICVVHGLGSGTDSRLPVMLLIEVLCIASVVGAVAWRLAAARGMPSGRRLAAAGATSAMVAGIGIFAVVGPLQPGWSRRAGTSSALLAQLNARFASSTAGLPTTAAPTTTAPSANSSSNSALPAAPFTDNVTGTARTSTPNSASEVEVQLVMQVQGTSAPLVVQLTGPETGGGVSMTSSNVTFGSAKGAVTALSGTTIAATVHDSNRRLNLIMQLAIDQNTGRISGSVSGTAG